MAASTDGGPWSTIVGGKTVIDGRSSVGVKTVGALSLPRRKIIGLHSVADGQLKLAPIKSSSSVLSEQKIWLIFIGQCNKDSTVRDIKEFLESNDITVSDVRWLNAKQSWQEKTAAYRVSVVMSC